MLQAPQAEAQALVTIPPHAQGQSCTMSSVPMSSNTGQTYHRDEQRDRLPEEYEAQELGYAA
jgi:hypothetical protein